MSRQNYYARRKQRRRRTVDHELVAGLVGRERQLQPRLGTRKVHHRLKGGNLRTPGTARGQTLFHVGDMLRYLDGLAGEQAES